MREENPESVAKTTVLFWHGGVLVHTRGMADRGAGTIVPPAPIERDLEKEHRALMLQLADHPDPHMRILAHISSRQFELSERMTELQSALTERLDGLEAKVERGFKNTADKIEELDKNYMTIEDRVEDHDRRFTNGSLRPSDAE